MRIFQGTEPEKVGSEARPYGQVADKAIVVCHDCDAYVRNAGRNFGYASLGGAIPAWNPEAKGDSIVHRTNAYFEWFLKQLPHPKRAHEETKKEMRRTNPDLMRYLIIAGHDNCDFVLALLQHVGVVKSNQKSRDVSIPKVLALYAGDFKNSLVERVNSESKKVEEMGIEELRLLAEEEMAFLSASNCLTYPVIGECLKNGTLNDIVVARLYIANNELVPFEGPRSIQFRKMLMEVRGESHNL
jgi:hypothetical protein